MVELGSLPGPVGLGGALLFSGHGSCSCDTGPAADRYKIVLNDKTRLDNAVQMKADGLRSHDEDALTHQMTCDDMSGEVDLVSFLS